MNRPCLIYKDSLYSGKLNRVQVIQKRFYSRKHALLIKNGSLALLLNTLFIIFILKCAIHFPFIKEMPNMIM